MRNIELTKYFVFVLFLIIGLANSVFETYAQEQFSQKQIAEFDSVLNKVTSDLKDSLITFELLLTIDSLKSSPISKLAPFYKKIYEELPLSVNKYKQQNKYAVYYVKGGDFIWSIAQNLLEDGSKWNVIYEANKDDIDNLINLKKGQRLKIPFNFNTSVEKTGKYTSFKNKKVYKNSVEYLSAAIKGKKLSEDEAQIRLKFLQTIGLSFDDDFFKLVYVTMPKELYNLAFNTNTQNQIKINSLLPLADSSSINKKTGGKTENINGDEETNNGKKNIKTNSEHNSGRQIEDIEIGELIIDQTISKIGKDFANLFYKEWNPPANIKSYTITIIEKPIPGLGTQITIKLNDLTVFQQRLQPKYDYIEDAAQLGVQYTLVYLMNYDAVMKSLGGDDMSGSGIY